MRELGTLLYRLAVEPTQVNHRTRWLVEAAVLAAIGAGLILAEALV